ncbi:MAG: hypothetical protein KKF65_04395, partial [Nanoarchaeota archaeon]|nr:hypothetical protein [Nanoarchaeota archaeon]
MIKLTGLISLLGLLNGLLKVYFNRCEMPIDNNYYGTVGRIFKIDNANKRLLVGAKDKAVWLYP